MSRRRWSRPAKTLKVYTEGTRSTSFAAASLLPLLAIYEAGVRLSTQDGSGLRNAIDVTLRYGISGLTIEVVPLAVLVIVAILFRAQRSGPGRIRPWWLVAFVAETACWALLVLAMMRFMKFLEPASLLSRVGRVFAAAAGAGVFEELTFRWGMAGGIRWALERAGGPPLLAWTLAVWTSSFAFAAAHVLGGVGGGIYADSFFRLTVLGLLLGTLYFTRGLAVAVYVHFFYDLFVAVL